MIPDLQPLVPISADVVVPDNGAEGVIVAEQTTSAGSLFVDAGRLTHTYSMMVFVYRQQADTPLPPRSDRGSGVAADAATPAIGGQATLFVNDAPLKQPMEHTVPMRFSAYSGLDMAGTTVAWST